MQVRMRLMVMMMISNKLVLVDVWLLLEARLVDVAGHHIAADVHTYFHVKHEVEVKELCAKKKSYAYPSPFSHFYFNSDRSRPLERTPIAVNTNRNQQKMATTVKVQIKGEETATELAMDVASVSIFIKEEMEKDTYSADTPIDLPECVTPTNFAKVLKYCEHFVEEPMTKIKMPLQSVEMKDNVQEWYADFATEQPQPELFELITVSNDLKIAPLMTLCSATVAAEMKKIPKEDLIKMFSAMGMLGGAPPGAMGAPPGLGMGAPPATGGSKKKKSGKKKK